MADNSSLLSGRMPMRQRRTDIPTLLRGLGAAATGQVPQFRQQMLAEEQYQRQSGLQDLQLQETLAKSAAMDAVRIKGLVEAGNVNQAIELLRDRADIEYRLGAPTDSTQNLMSMLVNDPMSVLPSLDSTIDSAYQIGLLQLPALSDLQRMGLEAEQADWNTARGSIVDTMEANNKLAADAVTGFNKLESLAGFIRQSQDPNATEIQKRSGRQAAATILTIMARMASPGVVTDRDFANQAGGQSLQAGVINYITNMGQRDPEIASLLANFDPTNPELLDVDALVGQARGLITGEAPSILSTYASQKERALAYRPSVRFMTAEFGENAGRNIRDLARISYGDEFDVRSFFSNPTGYLQQQLQSAPAVTQSTTEPGPTSQIIRFESLQEAEDYARQNPNADSNNFRVLNPSTGQYEEVI